MRITDIEIDPVAEQRIRRLIRVLLLAPNDDVPEWLRRRMVFWAYQDCLTEGMHAQAALVLNSVLGTVETRQFDPELPPDVYTPSPNMCVCGHAGTAHSLGGLMTRPGCRVDSCGCGGYWSETDAELAAQSAEELAALGEVALGNMPCQCGHEVNEHDPACGVCEMCDCGGYLPYDVTAI